MCGRSSAPTLSPSRGNPPPRSGRRIEADWAKLIKSWSPDLVDRRLRQITWPGIDQHRD
jgi:hypothetical protein